MLRLGCGNLLFSGQQLGMYRRKVDFFLGLCRAYIARNIQVKVVFLDFIHAHPAGVARLFFAVLVGADDFVDMLGQKLVLAFAFFKMLGCVDKQHIIWLFALFQHQNANGYACREKQIGGQPNHRINMPVFEQLGANTRLGTAAKQHAMRQDNGHNAVLLQKMKAVQQKRQNLPPTWALARNF